MAAFSIFGWLTMYDGTVLQNCTVVSDSKSTCSFLNFYTMDDLFFLITKFLEGTPLSRTTETLRSELLETGILGRAVDWRGSVAPVTFEGLAARFSSVRANQLSHIAEAYLSASHSASLLQPVPRSMIAQLAGSEDRPRQLLTEFRLNTVALSSARAGIRTSLAELQHLATVEARLIEATGVANAMDVDSESAASTAQRRQLNEVLRRKGDLLRKVY